MSKKTKKKEAEAAFDPRAQMQKVRTYVKGFINGKNPDQLNHLGEYPLNMDDAVRTIIALQDMLDDSMNRHDKASDHVHELVQANQGMAQHIFTSEAQHMLCHHGFEAEKAEMRQVIENLEAELMATRKELCETNSAFADILRKCDDKQHKLTAALTTIRTLMEGGV